MRRQRAGSDVGVEVSVLVDELVARAAKRGERPLHRPLAVVGVVRAVSRDPRVAVPASRTQPAAAARRHTPPAASRSGRCSVRMASRRGRRGGGRPRARMALPTRETHRGGLRRLMPWHLSSLRLGVAGCASSSMDASDARRSLRTPAPCLARSCAPRPFGTRSRTASLGRQPDLRAFSASARRAWEIRR